MINTFRGRTLEEGQKVKVYFNLHTHLFSVKDMATGLVVAHGNGMILEDVTFKVHEAGRQRVLEQKRKNVHAFVIGTYIGQAEEMTVPLRDAYYNPYMTDSFMDVATDTKLHTAQMVYLADKKIKYL